LGWAQKEVITKLRHFDLLLEKLDQFKKKGWLFTPALVA
jgi:hypothetical protein